MTDGLFSTGTWRDAREIPAALAATVDEASGFTDVARLLSRPHVRRIVVSGNGASYYVAKALWLAHLCSTSHTLPEIAAVPSGLLAGRQFRWRDGDVLLAISSSGELRDLIETIENRVQPEAFATITSNPAATIPSAASACAVVSVVSQRGVTHTQAFCGAIVAGLAIYARIAKDASLTSAVLDSPAMAERALGTATQWASHLTNVRAECPAALVYGSGPAWAAAMEGALLVKEIARVPCEAAETREAATASMTSLVPGHLAISLASRDVDPPLAEADRICHAAGATVVTTPREECHPYLAAVATFPAVLALSISLARLRGYDPDTPEWIHRYYETARRSSSQAVQATL